MKRIVRTARLPVKTVCVPASSRGRRLLLSALTALLFFAGPAAAESPAAAQQPAAGSVAGSGETPSGPASAPPSAQDRSPDSVVSAPAGTTVVAPLPQPPDRSAGGEDIVDSMHESITEGFLGSATWLDSFFGDERYEAEVNRSQLKIRFEAFREGGTGMDYRKPNFDLRLVLPQLRKKTRLVISGDPTVDYDTTTAPPATPAGQPPPPGGTGRVTTALQYFPVETTRSNLSLRAGLKLSSGKLQILLGPRYRYLVHAEPWDLRFTQEIVWTTDVGWQSLTRFDVERTVYESLFFRTTLEGVWSENVNGYPYALRFLLRQPLDTNRALEYEWISSFQTRPTNILTDELFVLRYRQRFWKDWLFLEIDPQISYPRSQSFTFTPGILFRLEMVFGQYGSLF